MTDHYNVISKQSAQNKRIVMRVDFNVPMQDGKILDDTRIKRVIPGIKTLLECSKQLILVTHLGRPKGNVDNTLSSQPLQEYLSNALSMSVRFIPHIEDPSQLSEAVDSHDKICLLENCRFYAGEEQNDQNLARAYASLADIYVNDAFSCSHRSHASIQAITVFLPSFAGPVLAAELTALSDALESPKRPVAAFVGGAKISTKLSVLENLISKVDKLLLAGAMANTFLAARQIPVAASLYEPDLIPTAKMISELAQQQGCEIILPVDGVVSTKLEKGGRFHTRLNGALEVNEMILDIGPASVALFKEHIKDCKTLLWNGPAGAFEIAPYDEASKSLGAFIGMRTRNGQLISVAGGGDTVAAVNLAGVADELTYVSLAGGAFLEWIEGKSLPGIEALQSSN
jgi:phosphoglycerate kinase